ncbi:hypothetical protein GGR57DRAFT_468799 [Xylariaceae sp. FL1272]|nr:hypothetical protein GGR57DRAFT_468799 [Xylariaceae sp. FL1272]
MPHRYNLHYLMWSCQMILSHVSLACEDRHEYRERIWSRPDIRPIEESYPGLMFLVCDINTCTAKAHSNDSSTIATRYNPYWLITVGIHQEC